MELDNEVKGNGNSYTTEFRQYDPRLGRWLSLDPLASSFPWQSPYCAFDNNPIFYTDPLGLAAEGGDDQDKKNEKDAKSQGLPDDAKHEQVSTGKNGKQYQYIEGEGGKGSWGEYKGDGAVVNASKKGGDDQASKPEENHSMMNSFFGVSSDGSSATDKISVYDQSNYDYCNSNPTILQNRLEANNRENGLLMYAGGSLAAPFLIFGAIEAAPIAFAAYSSASDALLYSYLSSEAIFSTAVTSVARTQIGRIALTSVSIFSGTNLYNYRNISVYRVYGGNAIRNGYSWTPINPNSISNYRNAAGLPNSNHAKFIISGVTRQSNIILSRPALPLDGNSGGLQEYLINPVNVNKGTPTIFK
jgi:RHS repeat-associated protein